MASCAAQPDKHFIFNVVNMSKGIKNLAGMDSSDPNYKKRCEEAKIMENWWMLLQILHTSRVLRCYNEKYPRILDFQYFQPHFRFKGNMDGDPQKVIEDFIKVEVRLHLVLVDTL